jgi:uncharacterized membrane protein
MFSECLASVGSSGSVFGLFAGILVDLLFNPSDHTPRPRLKTVYLSIFLCLSFLLGTLPAMDNFAHFGGFVTGWWGGCVLVPLNQTCKSTLDRRRLVKILYAMIWAMCIAFSTLLVYQGQLGEQCKVCYYINCLPITSTWCQRHFS